MLRCVEAGLELDYVSVDSAFGAGPDLPSSPRQKTCPQPLTSLGRECSSEHGPLAYRLFFSRFILNDVPMRDKDSVLNAHNLCGNPIHRNTETAKSPVHGVSLH